MGHHEVPADPAGQLGRRYLFALGLVALLQLLNQALVQPPTLRLLTDPPTINLAGRQRMLSQRIAKAALAMKVAPGELERQRRRAELAEVLKLWTSSHDRLKTSAEARRGFEDLEPFYEKLRGAASSLLGDDHRGASLAILDAEGQYLTRMDQIVGVYERAAQSHVNRLSAIGWGVTAMILIALAGIGAFVLRPAAALIDRQLAELRASRDDLEARVRERTLTLEQLNDDLARVAAQRARAEERQRAVVEQFSHVARTTAVGEMAGGLAHEINQPLGAIANYAEGCLVALDSPAPALDEVKTVLGKILATTLRAGAIVQRIRSFVTRHGTAREELEPNRLVVDVEEFFREEAARRGITLQLQLAPELPKIWGDPVQIQQVLLNLLRNALDALVALQPNQPSVVMATEIGPDDGVTFSVSDNGEGIPHERIDRIFDAYFSTRDQGMGMGLAISRTIVEAHHGRINVESEPGVGTTFRFTLPPSGIDDDDA